MFKLPENMFGLRSFIGRAIPYNVIYNAIYKKIEEIERIEDCYIYMQEVYFDSEDEKYAIYFREGSAYRLDFSIESGEVIFEDPVKIQFLHTPIEATTATRAKVYRAKSGEFKGRLVWYAVAASAVVNRVGEIDSVSLFDTFEREIDTYKQKPYMTFYHENDSKFHFGEVIGVKRDKNLLIAYGTIDEHHFIGSAAAKAINSGEWGLSIGFIPRDKPDEEEILDGVKIPIYKDGILVEISLLKEKDAASNFTNIVVDK